MAKARLLLALVSVAAVSLGTAAVASGEPSRSVVQAPAGAASPASLLGATPASTAIDFSVAVQLSDPAGAAALGRAVSDPASAGYRHFLTPEQWEKRFSPTRSSVDAVTAWLKSEGIAVEGVSADRMTVDASASAATIEHAFATGLGQYRRGHQIVRLASSPLQVPSSLAPLIAGVSGVDENLATPAAAGAETRRAAKAPGKELPQPPGFRNAPPCSSYYAQRRDTIDPPFGAGFPEPLPYAPCGYTPPQLQGAYGLSSQIAEGIDGKGVTVAVVDAYASPTLFADSRQYSQINQPSQVLRSGQFSEANSKTFNDIEACEASEWFGEQTLDVEAVHATAPGAKVLYVGAKNCSTGLYKAVQQVVDGHLADIITNSWGDNGGDLLDSTGSRHGFDNVLLMAIGTGIGVQFSSGDEGDEFAKLGMTVPDYPPSSPYATAVGGTSLQVSKDNTRSGELGWSTAKSTLCTALLAAEAAAGCKPSKVGKWLPPAPGAYLYGGGGGTSFQYPEPSYQQGVVPAQLAARNTSITGIANRVEPDISMNGDPTTGMLVGETQEFPDGTYYDQYRIGGTSLSSPLFAGVMALADQAAKGPLGFVNPLLYKLGASPATAAAAFYDIVPAGKQALVRNDYLNGVDATQGTITSVRVLDYQGREVHCSGTGNCAHQNVAIETAPGFDSMTGLGSPGAGLVAALAKP